MIQWVPCLNSSWKNISIHVVKYQTRWYFEKEMVLYCWCDIRWECFSFPNYLGNLTGCEEALLLKKIMSVRFGRMNLTLKCNLPFTGTFEFTQWTDLFISNKSDVFCFTACISWWSSWGSCPPPSWSRRWKYCNCQRY